VAPARQTVAMRKRETKTIEIEGDEEHRERGREKQKRKKKKKKIPAAQQPYSVLLLKNPNPIIHIPLLYTRAYTCVNELIIAAEYGAL